MEVFRDVDTPHVAIDPVVASIHGLKTVTDTIRVENSRRKLRIAATESPTYALENVRAWPSLPADLNIVVTERPFTSPRVLGQARTATDRSRLGSRIAVVSAHKENGRLATIARHELHHLVSGSSHCDTPDCLMQQNMTDRTSEACDACQSKFGMYAFHLLRAKQGYTVPQAILFPR